MSERDPAPRFSGQWIGATQGQPMPAHIWEISQRGQRLTIATRWEDGTAVGVFSALLEGEDGFSIAGGKFRAITLGAQHFVVPSWDTNDTRAGNGPHYDVVFARPGIAELAAGTIYLRYRQRLREAEV